MSLLGTLTKVAVGYATARGVDHFSKGGSMQDLMDQFRKNMSQAGVNIPGMADSQTPFDAFGGKNLQDMFGKLMGGQSADGSGSAGGAGLPGILASLGGIAASGQTGMQEAMRKMGAGSASDEMEVQAGLMLRAMIQAAKADGKIDQEEQKRILETAGDDADEHDITFLRTQLAAPVDTGSLAADTPPAMATQVYAASLLSIRVDTEAEKAYLRDLGRALSLDPQTVTGIHMQMGAPQP